MFLKEFSLIYLTVLMVLINSCFVVIYLQCKHKNKRPTQRTVDKVKSVLYELREFKATTKSS